LNCSTCSTAGETATVATAVSKATHVTALMRRMDPLFHLPNSERLPNGYGRTFFSMGDVMCPVPLCPVSVTVRAARHLRSVPNQDLSNLVRRDVTGQPPPGTFTFVGEIMS
jgi:hypothetical protein